jgi:hypothetical protein
MLGATAVVIVATGQTLANILILSATIIAASFVGFGAWRTFAPLVSEALGRGTVLVGGRTRAVLEREKTLALRAIKELEFDFAMGKMSQADFDEMSGRLRRRAMALMRQLDASATYRQQIDRDLAALLGRKPAAPSQPGGAPAPPAATASACASCQTVNDADARFCKQCGTALTV